MGTNESRPVYRGLIVPDPRALGEVWEAESTYTQAGSQPGIPVASTPSQMAIQASGEVDDNAAPLEVRSVRSGFPARDFGQRVIIRREATPAELWRSHWAAHLHNERREVDHSTGATIDHHKPDITALPEGGAVAVWTEHFTPGTETHTARRALDGTWTLDGKISAADLTVNNGAATITVLPSGRLLVLTTRYRADADDWTIDVYTSTDGGDTWGASARTVIPPLDAVRFGHPYDLKARYGGPGEILLMVYLKDSDATDQTDVLYQYASADLGASFVLVYGQDGSTGVVPTTPEEDEAFEDWLQAGGFPRVVADRGGFGVVYAEPNQSNHAYWRRLSSAFSPFLLAPPILVLPEVIANGTNFGEFDTHLAVCADLNGTLWVYLQAVTSFPFIFTAYSNEGGFQWSGAPDTGNPGGWPAMDWSGGGPPLIPERFAAAWDRGRIILLHTLSHDLPQVYKFSLYEWEMGGWNAPPPAIHTDSVAPGSLGSQDNLGWLYQPTTDPVTLGWSVFSAGASAGVADGLILSISSDAYRYYERTSIGGAEVTTGFLDARPFAAPASNLGIEVHISDGVNGFTAYAAVDGAGLVTVYDGFDDSIVNAVQVGAAGDRIQIALGMFIAPDGSAVASCEARVVQEAGEVDSPYDRPWVEVAGGWNSGGPEGGTTAHARWGALNRPPLVTVSRAGDIYHAGSADGGSLDVDSPSGWWVMPPSQDIGHQGRALTVIPEHTLDDLYLAAYGGPTFTGEEWLHTPVYDFGAINLTPRAVRSPSAGYKATDTGNQAIAWDFTGVTIPAYLETPILAVHVVDTNCPTWKVEGYNQLTLSWDVLATFDTRDAFGLLSVDFLADSVMTLGLTTAPTDAAGGYYVAAQELVGGYAWGVQGAFRIASNTGGLLTETETEETTKTPRLVLDGIYPLGGTPVDCRISPPSFTVLIRVDGQGGANTFRGFRVTMDTVAAGSPPLDGPPRAAKVVLGSAYLFGLDYDLTKTQTRRSAVDLDQDASGQVYTRVRGPTRRIVDVSWGGGGVWTRGVFDTLADEFATFSDAADAWPVTLIHEVPMMIDGLIDHLDGPHVPVVLLQDVPRLVDPATFVVLARNGAAGAIYGHLSGGVTLGKDAGEYAKDEKITLNLTIEEEV